MAEPLKNVLPPFGHLGLYAFRLPVLQQFIGLGLSRLKRIEKLEQLRLLENSMPIDVVLVDHCVQGVDRPEDIVVVDADIAGRRMAENLTE